MTLQLLPFLYTSALEIQSTAFTSFLLDASGEKFAVVFRVPKSGNISHVGFRTATVTTPQTLRVGIQTLSSGDASGSAYGSMTAGTQAAPASNTWYEVALGAAAAATAGDMVAAVIEFDSSVGNLNIAGCLSGSNGSLFPYPSLFTGSWARTSAPPILTVKYDDGTYGIIGAWPVSGISAANFNNASTPDEKALRFQLPFPARITGYEAMLSVASNAADFDVVLYSGTTALATASHDADNVSGTGSTRRIWGFFNSPQDLAANTVYRLALKPTTANNITNVEFTFPSNASMASIFGGIEWYWSERTDAGSWSDTTTKRPNIYPLFDKFDDGASGGGGNVFIHCE